MGRENGPIVIGTDTVSVAKNSVAYSKSFPLYGMNDFALEYQISCTGTPDVKAELQQSSDGENWYVPNGIADIVSSVTDKNIHGVQLAPITVTYLRIKLTEGTNTVTDTSVVIKLSGQRKIAD